MNPTNPGAVPDRYTVEDLSVDEPIDAANADTEAEFEEPAPDMGLPGNMNRLMQFIKSENIATLLSEDKLLEIGKKVTDDYDLDKDSCSDWYEVNEKALALAKQEGVHKSFPWEGAANVVVPIITSASIAYSARVLPEIIREGGVANTRVLGKMTDEKKDRADRVKNHLDYQLLFQMKEWRRDTDKLLSVYSVSGVAYRKVCYDPIKGRNVSMLLTPAEVIVNNGITSLETARRISHVMEMFGNDVESKKRAGLYRDVELHVDPSAGLEDAKQPDDDPAYKILEQHRWLDLDDDGYEEPYIVTVEKESAQVLRIVARYDERDVTHKDDVVVAIAARSYFVDYHFVPSFDGTFLSYGFGALLGSLNRAANSVLNALLNAGMLSNTQGGFLAKGFRMQGGNKPLAAGEWRKTEVPAEILQSSLLPIPAKEPSAVLGALLDKLIEMAQAIVSVQSIGLDQMPANAAASSVLSVIEQQSKVFNATFLRFYHSLSDELVLYGDLNARYLKDDEYFRLNDSEGSISRDDYATTDFDIIPVADPTITTQAQRMAIANTTFEVAKAVPGSNLVEAGRNVLKAIGAPDIDQIIAPSGAQTVPPEMQQQMQALQQQAQQATQLAQQMGDELKAVNQLLINKDKESAIKAYEAITKGEVGQSQIVKNLADAQAKGDSAAIAAYEAQLGAIGQLGKSLEATINAANNNAGNGGGMVEKPSDATTQGPAGFGA